MSVMTEAAPCVVFSLGLIENKERARGGRVGTREEKERAGRRREKGHCHQWL